jgi:hypothetical protein
MATSGCNFCGKVGTQPISNDRTTFNYDCLEVKNKKSNKTENQEKTAKNQSAKGNQVYRSKYCYLCVFLYGNQLTGNLKLVYYITLFKTSKTLTSETLTLKH